jgi:hypothetical protein
VLFRMLLTKNSLLTGSSELNEEYRYKNGRPNFVHGGLLCSKTLGGEGLETGTKRKYLIIYRKPGFLRVV